MLNGILKKVLFVLVVVVIFQNWGKIERVLNPSGVVSEQTRASARVVLYSTEWCGYCKATRRFLG
ncbi:glutaredoxin family protein [Pseudomonas fragi]|uniref:Glutaredoxin family protein n=1 Tax=Pseudomonas fragi TaxID=296 RepID=A0A449IFL1_PSEFR|nr:glutaredoxin family protein [Pseudomonas fragi]